MTHDLLSDMLEQLEAQVVRITVTELRENTFYAQITVAQDGAEIEVDSRPSDAIALAIRAEAPIFAADRVIEESAIEFEGEEVDPDQLEAEVAKFKHFLDEVTPDQFAVEDGDEEEERLAVSASTAAASAMPLKRPCTTMPGTTLFVRSRNQASAMPNGTSTSSASTSPCAAPNAKPTTIIEGQRPRNARSDCPTPRNVSSSTIGATTVKSTRFAANARACADSQCVGVRALLVARALRKRDHRHDRLEHVDREHRAHREAGRPAPGVAGRRSASRSQRSIAIASTRPSQNA